MDIPLSLDFLTQKRQLLFDVLDNLPLGIIAFDLSANLIFVNQTLADLLMLPLKELPYNTSFSELFDLGNRLITEINYHTDGGQKLRGRVFTSTGETIPVELQCLPMHNKQGELDGTVWLCQDLRQQLILERSHREYQHILDAVNTALIAVDANRVITTCNQAAAELLDLKIPQIVGSDMQEVLSGSRDLRSFLLQALRTGQPMFIQETMLEISDHKYSLSIDCTPLKDASGEISGAVLAVRDISMQRLIDEEANRTEKLALVSQIAAGTAHEIRNPLTSIRGFIQLLKARLPADSQEQGYLEIMLTELDRANNIVSNFLLLAKPHEPVFQLQDLNYILSDLLKLIEGQALLNDVQLISNFAPDIPLIVVESDSIKQVFLNLMQNAIHAMPNGGKLTVTTGFDPSGNQVIIKFTDTGVGIPKHLLNKLGRPYFTTRSNGTGLGLVTSYKIVANHHGSINVESQEDQGTTFTITLPCSA